MSELKSYEELKAAIADAYPGMSKQLQRIARYAMEKPHDLALATVATLAEANEVQPSSIIRFANALGFGGFSEMQQIFRGNLVARSDSYRERISRMRTDGEDASAARRKAAGSTGVLNQFVNESVSELEHLEGAVRAADFKAAVKVLASATHIHVLAQRRAFPVACYLSYALNQLEVRTHLLDGVGGMLSEFVRGIDRKEVLLAISFRNYSPDVIEAARSCHERGVQVIAITDSTLSPLKAVSSICFELGDDSTRPFRSLVAPLCLSQALVVSTGQFLEPRPTAASKATTKPVSKVSKKS